MLELLIPALIFLGIIAYVLVPIIRIRSLKPDSDVIRWINATHAVLTSVNNKNFQVFGGALPNDKKLRKCEINVLRQWWDIDGKKSLDDMVAWLENGGHRAEYDGNAKEVAAWDYSRALSLLSSGYLAGYLEREEALSRSLILAKRCQEEYASWDEFMDAYFKGYELWSNQGSGQRRKVYANIKSLPNSPYRLDWNMDLHKDWV